MKTNILIIFLSSLLSPFLAGQSDDLKDAADRAVTWLVSQQREDGSYGATVQSTGAALYAMAVCHRKYREGDGPFMRRGAEYLLSKVGEEKDGVALFFASAALGAVGTKGPPETIAALRRRVVELDFVIDPLSQTVQASPSSEEILRAQLPDGSWGHSIEETARSLIAISLKPPKPPPAPSLEEARRKGALFLLGQRQGAGLWGFPGRPDAGITGLAVSALLAVPVRSPDMEKAIEEGLRHLASLAKPDGSIFDRGYANYTTCIAVMAFVDAGKPELRPLVEKAQRYLLGLQACEQSGYRPEDKFYGGIGYGGSQRTDLSNTQFALEALSSSGIPKEHEAYRRALTFLTRSQNRTESNGFTVEVDGLTYVPGDDGGGVYYPGNSMAGYETLPDGRKVPRSYGSMTYALLRGYLFAGLPKQDPRLQAAVAWIEKNYTLTENPGFDRRQNPSAGMQGYFYYLLTMAKALDAMGLAKITTPDGLAHPWREELKAKLLSLQRPDGSWVNSASERWWEGSPVLATAYALATLKYVK